MIIREVSNVLESVSSEVSMRETSKTRENALKRERESSNVRESVSREVRTKETNDTFRSASRKVNMKECSKKIVGRVMYSHDFN